MTANAVLACVCFRPAASDRASSSVANYRASLRRTRSSVNLVGIKNAFLDVGGSNTEARCYLYASFRTHEWSYFIARLSANCFSSCFRLCRLDRIFEHQFSDLMLDRNRRRKFDLSSEPACVHWKLL